MTPKSHDAKVLLPVTGFRVPVGHSALSADCSMEFGPGLPTGCQANVQWTDGDDCLASSQPCQTMGP
jgi:hypothetical protein